MPGLALEDARRKGSETELLTVRQEGPEKIRAAAQIFTKGPFYLAIYSVVWKLIND